ncbi:hypothetical protein SAY86_001314 [Trapa natans]|uniref:MADS-box domain-containing protein n=1 Tax=Trapa natans TaxID=22666 RepID=A0AAN7MGA9_TRANT|nr:hypothetical protein SAY86_001314 [Trapa natans]
MGRGKLALEYIVKDRSRRTTFEKRKKGLMKKAEEFSILCGVDTCMIIYNDDEPLTWSPTVWPQDPEKAKKVIDRYLCEGVDRRRRHSMGLPEFFVGRKRKVDGELAKVRAANWAAKYPVSDEMVSGLSQDQLQSMLALLGVKLDSAKKRLLTVKEIAARNSFGINPMLHMGEEFKFNGSTINNLQIHDYGSMMEQTLPLDFAPLALGSYLPQVMDSKVVNNSFMWPLVGGGSAESYCNLSIPVADYSSHYQPINHQHTVPEPAMYPCDSLVGPGSLAAPSLALQQQQQQQQSWMQYPMKMTGMVQHQVAFRGFDGNSHGGGGDQRLSHHHHHV